MPLIAALCTNQTRIEMQTTQTTNTSGQGRSSELPEELKGWNWGAFFLNWIWGLGNSTFIALLMFVPFVNIIMVFVLGAKGNKWAWQNRIWRDIDHFRSVQRKWAIAGAIVFFVLFPLIIFTVISGLKGEAYQLSLKEIRANTEVQEALGQPIEPGFFVGGSVSVEAGGTGEAELQYSLSGSLEKGKAYVAADRFASTWKLGKVAVVVGEKQPPEIIRVVVPQQ